MRLQDYDARWRAGAGTLATVRVVITEIGWDGSIRRRAVGTGSLVRGFAANRLTGCPVKLDRTRYVAISTPSAAGPQRIRHASEYCGHRTRLHCQAAQRRHACGSGFLLRRPAGIAGRRRLVPMASH